MGLGDMELGFFALSMPPAEVAEVVLGAERFGFDEYTAAAEARFDPFIGLASAARTSTDIALRTGVAVAFARNPMSTAIMANDLQLLAKGRFRLGPGSQIKAHVTRRFSMPWHQSVARMRDYVQAIRAIWRCFQYGERLRYRGQFYRHTLMDQFFDAGPNPYGMPPILLGGVGRAMTQLAGEVADGFIAHNISTRRFLDEVTLPALRDGRASAGKPMAGFSVHLMPVIATGRDEAELSAAIQRTRQQVAFYTATPPYANVLELHGLSDVRTELHQLAAKGRFAEFAAVIDDDALDTLAFVGEPKDVAAKLMGTFAPIATSLCFYDFGVTDPAHWFPLCDSLRELQMAARQPRSATREKWRRFSTMSRAGEIAY